MYESDVVDFCDLGGSDVVVSTIHKAKGREFDDVFMLLNGDYGAAAVDCRRLYVGLTRARDRVFVHSSAPLFDGTAVDRMIVDQHLYGLPDEVVLQLSHKDVDLGFFKSKKETILSLRAGERLEFCNNYLYNEPDHRAVCRLSQRMRKELEEWSARGYAATHAMVRFVVAWKPRDAPREEKECAVVLADLHLQRMVGGEDGGRLGFGLAD